MVRCKFFACGPLLFAAAILLNSCGGGTTGSTSTPPSSPSTSPPPPAPTVTLAANPTAIQNGQSSTLAWKTTNASKVTISGIGSVQSTGSLQLTPPSTITYVLTATGSGGTKQSSIQITVSPVPPTQKIQHVIVIFQENRSTDNMFHGLPNADIATSGLNSKGESVVLFQEPLVNDYDIYHGHAGFVLMYDNGKMDGADKVGGWCGNGKSGCLPANYQFAYVNPNDLVPYFQMAQSYTFADRMFQTNQGPSFPAHQYIISGTSAPTETSNLFAAENPIGTDEFIKTGCNAPSDQTVALIDPQGNESSNVYPCFEHSTLIDLLDAKSLSWRYYTPTAGWIWTGPNAIKHLSSGPDWQNVIISQSQVLTDISSGQLPNVSWVIPTGQASDHALVNDGSGPSWVASIVNAVGTSPYWANTAIFITWDDWGGWYDHVPPPAIINSYEYGFRVPLILVSPYAKAGYVSHVTHDFGSILKFIETSFGLPSLGFADASADDFSDCFDFNQTPITFHSFNAPLKEGHFLHDKRPPADPDDD